MATAEQFQNLLNLFKQQEENQGLRTNVAQAEGTTGVAVPTTSTTNGYKPKKPERPIIFLAYADRFSGWLEVDKLCSGSFRDVRKSFLRWFGTYGVPEEIASDGGS